MRIRQPCPQVMMSRTLEACEPEYIDTLPSIVKEYWHCEYRTYVHDAMVESDFKIPIEEAMEKGKAAFEAAKAAGEPLWITPRDPIKPVRERDHAPIVYYMRMSDLVKIGTTIRIYSRFEAIHPQGVMAVEWGGRDLEQQRHKQFIDLHSHGEWFHLEPELVDHIFALREAFRGDKEENIDQWLEPRLPAHDRATRRPAWMVPLRRV